MESDIMEQFESLLPSRRTSTKRVTAPLWMGLIFLVLIVIVVIIVAMIAYNSKKKDSTGKNSTSDSQSLTAESSH